MLILTLLVVTAPISGIWAFIDGLTIVFGDYRHEDGSPLYERINGLGYFYVTVMLLTLLVVVLNMVSVAAVVLGALGSLGAGAGM